MQVETKSLRTALESLARVCKQRNHLPVLSHVLLHAIPGELSMKAQNLDETAGERITCAGDLEALCVDLRQLLYSIGAESCELMVRSGKLAVLAAGSVTNLSILPAKDFPDPVEDKFVNLGIACPELATAIKSVSFAVIFPDSDRTALKSVHLLSAPTLLQTEAANGRDLAVYAMPLINAVTDVLIPPEFVAGLAAALQRDGAVFAVGDRLLRVQHEAGDYTCKRADALYPNTKPIIGQGFEPLGKLKTAECSELFARCVHFAELNRMPKAIATFGPEGGKIEFDGSAKLSLIFSGSFEPRVSQLNAATFLACLSAFDSDEIELDTGEDCLRLRAENLTVITMEIPKGA